MGLFPDSRIEVSSVAYNLAGDDLSQRPNFLKSTVSAGVLGNRQLSFSNHIQRSYMDGPGMKLRRFYDWAQNDTNYGYIGMPTASFRGFKTDSSEFEKAILRQYGQVPPDQEPSATFKVLKWQVGRCDYTWYATRWVWGNKSAQEFRSAWTAQMDPATNLITVTAANNSWTHTFDPNNFDDSGWTPPFDPQRRYVYSYIKRGAFGSVVWMYRFGDGWAELDGMQQAIDDFDFGFYPPIPIRSDSTFYSDTYQPHVWNQAKRGYKKMTGGEITDITDVLAGNANIADIDYAYVLPGISVSLEDNTGRQYMYEFFKWLRDTQMASPSLATFTAQDNAYRAAVADWLAWNSGGRVGTEPTLPAIPRIPTSSIRIKASGATDSNLDVEIEWKYIGEETGSGLKKPNATVGELWWDTDPRDDPPVPFLHDDGGAIISTRFTSNVIRLHWQVTADTWKSMVLVGMVHRNYIYANNYNVETTLKAALEDNDESGFIVPLHRPVMAGMGVVKYTELSTNCFYLVLNMWKKVKASWLSFIIFIVAIALMVIFPPLNVGLLGAGATVGAALGFTGIMAAIVGALVNMVAAMIVMKIIQKVSVAIFGAKIGAIIGAVASFVAMTVGTGLALGQNMSTIWNNLMSAQGLIALTNAVGSGVAGYVSAAIREVYEDIHNLNEDYKEQSEKISDLYAENIGYDMGVINPLGLTDTFSAFMETPQQFLSRTLLTGMDIAEITNEMLTNFAQLTTRVDLPLSSE